MPESFPAAVLLVEDELPIRKFLAASLVSAGYHVEEAVSGQEALRYSSQRPPDLVILDLGLPDMDGQDVLRQLREWLTAPIIVVSARDQEQQKIAALDNGANDYLTKPFSTGELLARIRAALRYSHPPGDGKNVTRFEAGDLKIDFSSRRIYVRNSEVHLTPIEFKLLTILAHNAGKVLTHRQLLNEVWGPQQTHETHYLRVFMANLRRKIESDPAQPRILLTEQGVGYRLAVD
jgi:two-component system KDP operon response regulator KdpE